MSIKHKNYNRGLDLKETIDSIQTYIEDYARIIMKVPAPIIPNLEIAVSKLTDNPSLKKGVCYLCKKKINEGDGRFERILCMNCGFKELPNVVIKCQ